MVTVFCPDRSLTWCKVIGSDTYMSAQADMLLEVWNNDTNTLIERRWNKGGGTFGDNNHPSGSELTVADNTILKLKVYNLSKNKLPMQVIVFHSETGDTNDYSTYPTGMVDTVGSVSGSSVKLHKEIIGGQQVEMLFQVTPHTNNWWKINCNCIFAVGSVFTPTNPNNGIDYGADFFNLEYYAGYIRWKNPSIALGNQIYLENTATWATENSTASNPFYDAGLNTLDCSMIVAGKLLSTWNNAGDGVTTLLNQPFEAWNLNGDGFWPLKILKKDNSGNLLWFEARGRDAFLNFTLASGITADKKNCFQGSDVGLNFQTYTTPAGYIKDGNIFKKTSVPSAPTPNSSTIILGNVISGVADQAGIINIYDFTSSIVIATVATSGNNNAWVWTPVSIGLYRFKNTNNNGTSPYSSTISVTQSVSNEFDYTITQIDNDCGKNVQYGIKMLPEDGIEWQDSNIFLNKPDGSPRFYLRNKDNQTEVSEAYLITVVL